MIDAIVLYVLILVLLTLTLIQGHRGARRQDLCASYLTKFSISLNGTWYIVLTCSCAEPRVHFTSSIQYSRKRTLLMSFHFKKKLNIGLYSDSYRPICFKLGMIDDIDH